MGINVIDIRRLHLRVSECLSHRLGGGRWVRAGNDQVMCVAAGTAAGQLSINTGGAIACRRRRLKNEERTPFSHDEAIALPVERPRCLRGGVVSPRKGA